MREKILKTYSVVIFTSAVLISIITVFASGIYSDYYSEEPSPSAVSFHSTALIPPIALILGSTVGLVFSFAFGEKDDSVREKLGRVGTYCKDNCYKPDISYIFNTIGIFAGVMSVIVFFFYDFFFSKLIK